MEGKGKTMKRINISIDDKTEALLVRVGKKSTYIDRVLRDGWRAWQSGLAVVLRTGWESSEILAICEILTGTVFQLGEYRGFILARRLDAWGNEELLTKHRITFERWSEIVQSVRSSDELAHALIIVVEEYWRHNSEIIESIRRLGIVQ